MNYKDKYSELVRIVENRIIEVIPNIKPFELYEPFRYIMKEGGKRLRPVLAMICTGAVGRDPILALDSAVALEILHNFTLVHDDIMDNSSMRRGRATIHEKWDSATAILTGDVMIGYAYNLLPNSKQSSRSDEILKIFTKELIEVCEGQVLDMTFNERKNVSIDDYIEMIDKKTARLIETSAIIGAHIGEASSEEIEAIRNISRNIGLAFQIQDDLLDMTASESDFGKQIGNDIIEGKKTFLIINAQKKVDDKNDKLLIEKFINQNGLSKEEVPIIDELFKRNNIYLDAQQEIDLYLEKALINLEFLKKNDYTDMLLQLIQSLNKRLI